MQSTDEQAPKRYSLAPNKGMEQGKGTREITGSALKQASRAASNLETKVRRDGTRSTSAVTRIPLSGPLSSQGDEIYGEADTTTTDGSEQSSPRAQTLTAAALCLYDDDANIVTAGNTASNTTSSGDDKCTPAKDAKKPTLSSDQYGLPVPIEDRVQCETHAAVIARLPPPEFVSSISEWGASSSGGEGVKRAGNTMPTLMFDLGSTSDQSVEEGYSRKRRKRRKLVERQQMKSIQDNSYESGTDDGYAGEESSSPMPSSCSSDSISSGEEQPYKRKRLQHADGYSDSDSTEDFEQSESGMPYSSCAENSSDEGVPFNLVGLKMEIATRRKFQASSLLQTNYETAMYGKGVANKRKKQRTSGSAGLKLAPAKISSSRGDYKLEPTTASGRPSIFSLNTDVMALCMTFLEPPEVHSLLTMPLSKEWRATFSIPQELWRVLCLMEPFKAKVDIDGHESDDSSFSMLSDGKHLLGSHRLLYTSFVLCLRYLARIKDDALNGRAPSVQGYGLGEVSPLRANVNLKSFLAHARGVIIKNKKMSQADKHDSSSEGLEMPIGVTDENSSVESIPKAAAARRTKKVKETKLSKKPTYGHSQLTQRLLGPSKTGDPGNVNLPWSCAIYSIVNWMVAFSDVEGIQTMCLKVLPYLLEDESQRTTAQRAGLTDVVLRGMVLFPDSIQLHTAAFHTIVLLARPLGGREGMLFHCSMVNSSGIFNDGSKSGKSGIAVMLDSMRRFQQDEVLQAMSCWSLVNIALAPSQKAILVKLGGISTVANAMIQHPYNAEVQFRALFALINLVIPAVNPADDRTDTNAYVAQVLMEDDDDMSEKEMLDDSVSQIANLVVLAMKNFCASESILNRACLVLHNLSLTDDYHCILLWTPNCYQMLEWCLANYRTDQVLQQSAAGTLHRLQTTLSNNDDLRHRFTSSLQTQKRKSLEQAHQEALLLHQQEEQQLSNQAQQQL